jgi:hypothetical protein
MYSSLKFLYSLANSGRKGILSVVPWVRNNSVQRELGANLKQVSRRPQGLLALPTEILVLIVKELEWDDVLRLRIVR